MSFHDESWDFLSSPMLMPTGGESIESPIERAFFRCFHYICLGFPNARGLILRPQVRLGAYRADFTLGFADQRALLVIECDGHKFHDGDRASAARDKARDRWMTAQGYAIYRFTGSEIYARPYICVAEAIEFAMNRLGERASA